MPKLIVQLPGGTEVSHELSEDVITLGRLSDNLVQIDDASVSSHHAELTLVGTEYLLKDLDSTNGTRVNGRTFTEGMLSDRDRVQFGKIDARYASEHASDAKPLPEPEHLAVEAAASSARPEDFSNASPFKTKMKKKDPTAAAILAFAGIAVAAFIGAVVSIYHAATAAIAVEFPAGEVPAGRLPFRFRHSPFGGRRLLGGMLPPCLARHRHRRGAPAGNRGAPCLDGCPAAHPVRLRGCTPLGRAHAARRAAL